MDNKHEPFVSRFAIGKEVIIKAKIAGVQFTESKVRYVFDLGSGLALVDSDLVEAQGHQPNDEEYQQGLAEGRRQAYFNPQDFDLDIPEQAVVFGMTENQVRNTTALRDTPWRMEQERRRCGWRAPVIPSSLLVKCEGSNND